MGMKSLCLYLTLKLGFGQDLFVPNDLAFGQDLVVPHDRYLQDTCPDIPPNSHHTCAQQKEWGKCGASWMRGYCCKTCFNCQCRVHPPSSQYTCAQQNAWGKCGASWMRGYCCKTCFNC